MRNSDDHSTPVSPPKTTGRRWFRRTVIAVVAFLVVAVAAAPYIAQTPPMLDWIVGAVAARENVQADLESASFGWFAPLELRGLHVRSPYGDPLLDVARIRADRPAWQLALAGRRLGHFIVEHPDVAIIAKPSGWNFQGIGSKREPSDATAPSRQPVLSADLRDAAVSLYRAGVDEPIVDVEGVDATVRLQYVDDTRWLTVLPFQPLDHKPLTPEMCGNGLQLIAPILAYSAWVEGEASLSIDEFRLPLDHPALQEGEVEPTAFASGELKLHSVETGLKNPLVQEIAAKVATLLGAEMPTRVRIADESQVRFQLRERRVHHEGLAFGLPEVSPTLLIHTSGAVGFDKSLDLRVEVPLPLDLAFQGPIAQRLSGKSVQLSVTGTLDDPQVSFPPGKGVVRQFADLLRETPEEPGEAGEVVASEVATLAEELLPVAREVSQNVVESLSDTLARIRERRAERRSGRNLETADRNPYEERANGYDDGPVDYSGDALPPSPLEESDDGRGGESWDEESLDDAPDAKVEPPARQGRLRRFFRNRRDREENP